MINGIYSVPRGRKQDYDQQYIKIDKTFDIKKDNSEHFKDLIYIKKQKKKTHAR